MTASDDTIPFQRVVARRAARGAGPPRHQPRLPVALRAGVRDMIRERLARTRGRRGRRSQACWSIVYDHHQRELAQQLIDINYNEHGARVCRTHVHLDQQTA